MKKKQLVLSLSKDNGDFIVETFSGSGAGGQNRNRKQKCVRIKHPASKSVAVATEERSLEQNKRKAFKRLINSDSFKKWHKMEVARICGNIDSVEEIVNQGMNPKNIKVEVRKSGNWVTE